MRLEKTLDAETNKLLKISDDEVDVQLAAFRGNRDLADCSELGKLFTMDDDENQARAAKIDFTVLKTTFALIGGVGLIFTFVFSDFLSRLVSAFSGFYEKDFFVLDEDEQRERLFVFIRNVLLV